MVEALIVILNAYTYAFTFNYITFYCTEMCHIQKALGLQSIKEGVEPSPTGTNRVVRPMPQQLRHSADCAAVDQIGICNDFKRN